jgi:hypothetical protein
MAILYISEYSGTAMKNAQTIGSVRTPPLAEQQVTVSGASTQSTAFNANTSIVRIRCGGLNANGVVLKFGTNPTAVAATGGLSLSVGQTEYFVVDASSSKVAVVSATE